MPVNLSLFETFICDDFVILIIEETPVKINQPPIEYTVTAKLNPNLIDIEKLKSLSKPKLNDEIIPIELMTDFTKNQITIGRVKYSKIIEVNRLEFPL